VATSHSAGAKKTHKFTQHITNVSAPLALAHLARRHVRRSLSALREQLRA